MKNLMKNFDILAISMMAVLGLQSCSQETPFSVNSSEGSLRISTEFRGDVTVATRAAADYDQETLNKNLVIYIEKNNNVIRKFLGKENVPPVISLPTGDYVAEAWTGDAVPASFDKKFYRTSTEFSIGEGSNELKLNLNIANVLVSIDQTSLESPIKDLIVTVNHSRDKLVFENELLDKKGYFMMPDVDTDLHYVLKGTAQDGSSFQKEGDITNVESATEYIIKLYTDAPENEKGGAFIKIEIEKVNVIDETATVYPAPSFKAFYGNDLIDLTNNQLVKQTTGFNELKLRIVTYKSLSNLTFNFNNPFQGYGNINGQNVNSNIKSLLEQKGISFEQQTVNVTSSDSNGESMNAIETMITFTKDFLDGLPEDILPYKIDLNVVDGRGFSNTITVNIATTDEAIEKPDPVISAESPDPEEEPLAILTNTAILTGYVNSESAENYGIKYREKGNGDYIEVLADGLSTRALSSYTVTLTGLKPGTIYEYKSFCDGFEELTPKTFETESIFQIPNASMEIWSTNSDHVKNAPNPNADGVRSFWDTGNHGAMKFGDPITESSTTMHGKGNYSARLVSMFKGVVGIGKFAAGNLFIGSYVKTDGTDGVLSLGREFNGSHPSAMKLWVNYRPQKVEVDKTVTLNGETIMKKGDLDKGQIYVALSTQPVEIRTKTSDQKLFNKDDAEIIAYGQYTFDGDYGEDGQLQELIIPFEYKKKTAEQNKPLYIIMVCSASKYGDYFIGGEKSTMYLDDFELEYGDIQFE